MAWCKTGWYRPKQNEKDWLLLASTGFEACRTDREEGLSRGGSNRDPHKFGLRAWRGGGGDLAFGPQAGIPAFRALGGAPCRSAPV